MVTNDERISKDVNNWVILQSKNSTLIKELWALYKIITLHRIIVLIAGENSHKNGDTSYRKNLSREIYHTSRKCFHSQKTGGGGALN